jgi:polyether ionophore transport system ATP-binding protein
MTSSAIVTKGLTKRFGRVSALENLDLEVVPGEVLGCLGPNGAGKTTAIRLLLGLLEPTSGSCQLFGVDATRHPVEAHRRVAFVPGEADLWPRLTGEETLHLLGRVHGQVDEAYRDELIERFQLDSSKKARAYSKGNRQKVILIAALMTRADLLILDEPTSGLDPLMEHVFRSCVDEAKGRGQTVFLSSHILSEVEALCDRVAILRQGRLVELGTLGELRHLAALSVNATFNGPVPDLAGVQGVSHVVRDGHAVHLQLRGSVRPLIQELAATDVTGLQSREPSLEELFVSHYGAGKTYGDGDGHR